jgi:hypothetical protein
MLLVRSPNHRGRCWSGSRVHHCRHRHRSRHAPMHYRVWMEWCVLWGGMDRFLGSVFKDSFIISFSALLEPTEGSSSCFVLLLS